MSHDQESLKGSLSLRLKGAGAEPPALPDEVVAAVLLAMVAGSAGMPVVWIS